MKRLLILIPALAFLATASSAWAIGGVDTPPAPSERHEMKFATPKETRLENGLRVIVAERPGLAAARRPGCWCATAPRSIPRVSPAPPA